jgi:sec-independent protein translocase protein TatA
MSSLHTLAFLNSFGTWDMVLILGIGLLLFGKRLPDVGRSLGKGIVEFKKGLKGIEDDVETESSRSRRAAELPADRAEYRALPREDRRVGRGDEVEAPGRAEPQGQ